MKQEQISKILEGVVIAVLGILIAIYGAGAVIDIYFGIAGIITGTVLLLFCGFLIAKKQPLPFLLLFLGAFCITVSVALFIKEVSVAFLIQFGVLAILALGCAAVVYGVYLIAKKQTPLGIANSVFGAVCIVLSALYLAIADFRTAFWIVVGVLMAVYGVLGIVFAILNNKKK